ncbi:hypothetical protein [Pelomonas sp. SE-A7]|uniref:hypothetical protein n=1 Tax=Pelomonas sp. SE-A7 TaxID=3054953 RepID=UPI00259C82C4|nr:hypothetical protein [Pelomonas sp. SE-A7]MDM4765199.1 hypothetical protein [Pelomonas sp. SE-A7]
MSVQRRHLLQAAGLAALPRFSTAGEAGYDWRSLAFGAGGFVDGFVFHPRERGLLYARTDIGGAYRFNDASKSWVPLLDHLSKADSDLMGVLALAVDPSDANRVYAACGLYTVAWARKAALLSSNDRGASWQQHELDFRLAGNGPGRGTGERLQVDPNRPERLLLGTTEDGLQQSLDRGAHFSRLAGFPARHVSLVLFDPRSGQPGQGTATVYVGSHDQPGLYVSHDAGQSFARVPGLPAQAPQRAAFGPEGSLYVSFAAGEGGAVVNPSHAKTGSVWRRDPAGRWREITPVKPTASEPFGYSGLDVDARKPGRLVVSTIERWSAGDEVFLSDDQGETWTALSPRSRHDDSRHPWLQAYQKKTRHPQGHWLADLKIDPFDSERAVYGTGYGVWMSSGLGQARVDWRFAVDNMEETAVLGLESPSGGASLLAAMGDVSGAAWDDLNQGPRNGLFLPAGETCRSVSVAELKPGIVARTSDMAATGGYCSVDGGASWRPFGPSSRVSKTREGWRAPTGQVAVSAQGGFFLWAPDKQPALWSRDRGRSWSSCQGWPVDAEVALSPVADRTVEGVFYVHDRAGGQVLVSVDGGASFQSAIGGLPKLQQWQGAHLACAPGQARDLWLALPDGLLHIPGVDAKARTVRGVAEAWRVALGKAAEGASYHAVYVWGRLMQGGAAVEGLFRSIDGGASFQRINDDAHRYGRLNAMAADPLEFGVVYLAPEGRGVIIGRPA